MRTILAMLLAVAVLTAPAAAADVDGLLTLGDWRGNPWVARN